jgi:hypothetical protein
MARLDSNLLCLMLIKEHSFTHPRATLDSILLCRSPIQEYRVTPHRTSLDGILLRHITLQEAKAIWANNKSIRPTKSKADSLLSLSKWSKPISTSIRLINFLKVRLVSLLKDRLNMICQASLDYHFPHLSSATRLIYSGF